MKKEKLFTLTEKDFDFIFQRGRGNGGQKKNKTSSACICSHKPSGAQGYAEDHREQSQNKKLAFKRMTETAEFQSWLRVKIDAACGNVEIEEADDFGILRKRKVNHEEI
jgi:protein subunit release factor A